ncbi:MAG: hypothetical protein JWN95_1711 [Frankiales bacterium]|nr:hypothetical protein [Frankiales bacterium]
MTRRTTYARNSKKPWLLLAAATLAVLLTGIGVGAITTRRLFTRLPSLMLTAPNQPAAAATAALVLTGGCDV